MTELIFWETIIRGTAVSFALDVDTAFLFGLRTEQRMWDNCSGWSEVALFVGPLVMTVTLYRSKS